MINLDQKFYLYYLIRFNDQHGDNIRFTILVRNDLFDDIGNKLDHCFTSFFSKYENDEASVPITGIQLPYPTHVVHFGLYKLMYEEQMLKIYELQFKCSQTIIHALSGEEISEASIYILSLYLHTSIFKLCTQYYAGNAEELLTRIFRTQDHLMPLTPQLVAAMEENQALFFEITDEIMRVKNFEGAIGWLNDWFRLSELTIQEELATIANSNFHENEITTLTNFYHTQTKGINVQLGITGKVSTILNEMLKRSWVNFYKCIQPTKPIFSGMNSLNSYVEKVKL